MADQESTGNQDQAGQGPAGANMLNGADTAGAGTQQQEPKTFDEAYVKKLRAEAAANRTRATELEAWKTQREQADMSELERARAQAEAAQKLASEAQTQWAKAQRDLHITQAAAKAGFPPEAALKLAEVEVAEDGTVSGVDEAIAKLVSTYPGMMSQQAGGSNGSSMNGSRAKKKTLLTKAEIQGKSAQWRSENWALVQESLANL